MNPPCNDWYKLSDNLSGRWRELFDSFSASNLRPEPPPAVRSGSGLILSAPDGGNGSDLVATPRTPRGVDLPNACFSADACAGLMIMSDRVELAERLFVAVLASKPAERDALLEKLCGDDRELRRMVEKLLSEDARAGSFLEHPPLDFLDRAMKYAPPATGESGDSDGVEGSASNLTGRLAPGECLIGRFVIARFIAKGGMGEVYEAEDRYLKGKHVALKTIRADIGDDPALQRRFESEVLLAREVSHPNLCPIYEIFHCEEPPPGFLFLTMKFLPGETLAARLRKSGPVGREEGTAIVRQMADGLAAIHRAGVIHRDIKPNNVMLDGSGSGVRLYITDFGLARALEAESTISSSGGLIVAGTPGYLAPELLQGRPPSQASDLFAFGVVLHEAFTGEKPAACEDGRSVVVSPRMNSSGAPSECGDLVKACLDQDPERRRRAFERYLGGKPGNWTPGSWTRRAFIGTAAAAACSLAGVVWWGRDDLENVLYPLPGKRFVALLSWPKTSDSHVAPMLTGVLTAIKGELARLEAFDRNLFVISPDEVNKELADAAHLQEVCDPLGANLALAASGVPGARYFELVLRLLDPLTSRTIRKRELSCAWADITLLPSRAVQAAASLLNLSHYLKAGLETAPGTQSAAAFTAFQSAETLMKQPNDTGMDAAIEKYKEAVELDPRFAVAHAALAIAYCHLYTIRRDPAALDLAHGNAARALALDRDLVEAHLALASVLELTGDEQGALDELAKALVLDPSNPRTLVWQAQLYTRLNRPADAERTFERVLRERPNYWLAYNELGFALHREARYQEAIRQFRAASLAAPGSSMALSNLGGEYLQVGEFSEATDTLKRSLALDPHSDQAASGLSLALRYQGKYAEALPYAQKAVELNPADDTNWLELGDCYSSLRNRQSEARAAYQRAAREAEQHLRTEASDGPSWMLLALYKVKSGDTKDAASLIKKAESLGATDMDSQLYKARILELIGKREEALSTLQACFRKGARALQIESFPDMDALRKDPRYRQIAVSS